VGSVLLVIVQYTVTPSEGLEGDSMVSIFTRQFRFALIFLQLLGLPKETLTCTNTQHVDFVYMLLFYLLLDNNSHDGFE